MIDQSMFDKPLPFRIRKLESKDLPSVISIDRMVFKNPWPESAFVQELYFNPHARYFVLELTQPVKIHLWREWRIDRNRQMIGFVGVRVERGEGHISTLAIHPEWRGWGLGELLLQRALEQAIENDAETVSLEVRISNAVAQTLYAKYGFTTVSRLRGYYADGEDAHLMRTTVLDYDYRQYLSERQAALLARFQTHPVSPQNIG